MHVGYALTNGIFDYMGWKRGIRVLFGCYPGREGGDIGESYIL